MAKQIIPSIFGITFLFVPLALPKELTLGKMQINLLLHSLNRTLAVAEGTSARKNSNKFGFSLA
ncbi:MAG: hypothetical protein HUK03_10110 [Bacteroidaceae bacterium]|nr:hypothetical protein [Bacteroidaceae bacterium]